MQMQTGYIETLDLRNGRNFSGILHKNWGLFACFSLCNANLGLLSGLL